MKLHVWCSWGIGASITADAFQLPLALYIYSIQSLAIFSFLLWTWQWYWHRIRASLVSVSGDRGMTTGSCSRWSVISDDRWRFDQFDPIFLSGSCDLVFACFQSWFSFFRTSELLYVHLKSVTWFPTHLEVERCDTNSSFQRHLWSFFRSRACGRSCRQLGCGRYRGR